MRYQFKPLFEYQFKLMSIFFIIIIPFDIGCILVCLENVDYAYLITCVIITALPFLAFIITRLVYPKKYLLDDEYLTKYYGKKVIFKIKKSNIKAIIIKRRKPTDYFKFLFDMFIGYFGDPHSCCVSFLYINAEIKLEEKKEIILPSLQSNNSEFNEYTDIIPYYVCKKMCAILNITPLTK